MNELTKASAIVVILGTIAILLISALYDLLFAGGSKTVGLVAVILLLIGTGLLLTRD